MREAIQETLRAVPAPAPAAPAAAFDAGELAGVLRGALQESVAELAREFRSGSPAPAAPVSAPANPIDIPQFADAVRDSVAGAMQEAMAVLLVQLRASAAPPAEAPAAPAAPMPDAQQMAEMIRDSVGGAIQEAMASMVVQMRAMASKPDSSLPAEAIGQVAEAVKEAVAGVQQAQAAQESRLTEIAEAMLSTVKQTGELMEQKVVADNTLQDLRRGRRHASVTPFRDMRGGGAPPPGADEADQRVLEALESEHPLEALNFDNFFPGNANAFSFQVARAVAAQPGAEYNPFFLYGHVGVGKTHLISAMGNTILSGHPEARVGYVSASHFARRLGEALQENAQDAFRENYCHWDVLILDDIQFMGGKVEAQEEFFHIFNVLHQQGRQIIIAGDKAPDRLGLLEQRLISRFASGIVAELKVPEYETRMKILRHAVETGGAKVPEEVLSLIAMRVKYDVRKMMGSLRKVTAFAKLVGQEMSVEMASEILSHLGVEEAA
jgi:chromosomal replication initiator protein DnaA